MDQQECEKPNRLAREKSPYLRQHACNPIDWRPWGPEALREAREKDKPLFISIGYSACHWCHVMEREVFSDPHVAEVLNRVFINIKVDREERPDVDHYYMLYCQIAGRGCGWPLNIFALPDGTPFYTFTYVNKMQMLQLAHSVENSWRTDRESIIQAARQGQQYMEKALAPPPASPQGLEDVFLRTVRRELERTFDRVNGGFGYRPKFPMPHALVFLTRQSCLEKDVATRLRGMVEKTLDSMLRGGVYDLVGGGLHRYSVDEEWKVPHFEKMLYDQAGFIEALLEAARAWRNPVYAEKALEVARFLGREMWSGEYFYTSIDADAAGEEGLYYTFTLDEVREALGDEDLLETAKRIFNLRKVGNYLEEYTELPNGRNIIRLVKPLDDLASELGMSREDLEKRLKTILERLRAYREENKPRPQVDTKALTDWNMMTTASLALLYRAAGDEKSLAMARKAYETFRDKALTSGVFAHQPHSATPGPLDDQVYALKAQLELYQATLKARYLADAIEAAQSITRLYRREPGLYYYLPPNVPSPLAGRPAESFDEAHASALSVLAESLLRLAQVTGDRETEREAVEIIKRHAQRARKYPAGHIGMALAVQRSLVDAQRLVVTTPPDTSAATGIARGLWKDVYAPFLELLAKDGSLPPLPDKSLKTMTPTCSGGPTLYLCWSDRCDLPACSYEDVVKRLLEGACNMKGT